MFTLLPYKQETPTPLRDAFEGGFGPLFRLLDGGTVAGAADFNPALDVKESKDAYTVSADLPGLEKKDIQVRVEEGVLSIAGERKAGHQEESKEHSWLRVERGWGGFERRLRLGDGVDGDKVAAEYKDGVLTVTVPKKESAQPRLVEVR